MHDLNTVVSVIKEVNIKGNKTTAKVEFNNIFSKVKKKSVVPLEKKVVKERTKTLFGVRKKRKLMLNWPRDIFYNSRWLQKLINKTMSRGKKGRAEKIALQMLTLINQDVSGNALLIFHQALSQIKPVLTVISRRVGRRIYQVPVPLETFKQYKTALKWLIVIAKKNKQAPLAETLANELINTVFFKRSESLRRKNELYEIVVKNRAYTHYRWI